MMLLSDWYLARQEKRIQAAAEAAAKAAREEGRKEGYAEGYAAAKAENGITVEKSPEPPPKSSTI